MPLLRDVVLNTSYTVNGDNFICFKCKKRIYKNETVILATDNEGRLVVKHEFSCHKTKSTYDDYLKEKK